ncbi:MAG: hypothetical protein FVQ79_00690 [Planctomycetes bacterium]|nr:hypothetical protein [Planctomycetota bacterium]
MAIIVGILINVPVAPVNAATTNYSSAIPGVVVIPIQLPGQHTADVTAIVKFKMPFACNIVGVSANARASGGTSPTLTVDLLDDGTSALSAPISLTAGTVSEGTVTNATVVDESVMTIDFVITGSTPTWDDVTVFITVIRT